jgi:ComF family protein
MSNTLTGFQTLLGLSGKRLTSNTLTGCGTLLGLGMNGLNNLLHLFFPRLCVLCDHLLTEDEKHICMHCFCDLPRTNYHKRLFNPLLKLFAGTTQINTISSFLLFEKDGKVQRLIHSIKYFGNKQLAKYLGRIAAFETKEDGIFRGIDLLIPVPLHPKKQWKRGFNKSEWIAKGMETVCQCPIVTDVLFRKKHTDTQTRKSIYERHLNVEEIFSLKNADSLQGKHILLIDDVITTGATLNACIKTLSAIPDLRISIFSLSVVHVW